MVETHEVHILVKNTLEKALDVLNLKGLLVVALKMSIDARNTSALVFGWLGSTTAVGVALAAAADCGAALDYFCPAILTFAAPNILMVVLVD